MSDQMREPTTSGIQGKAVEPYLQELRNLCSYYLKCLSKDMAVEVSCFSDSFKDDLDYAQVEKLPIQDSIPEEVASAKVVRKLLSKLGHDRNQKELRIGYPLHVSRHFSKKTDRSFFKVQPLLLCNVAFENGGNRLFIDPETLDINPKAISEVSGQRDSDVVFEILQLVRDIGLANSVTIEMSMREMALAIEKARPEWPWLNKLNAEALEPIQVKSITQQGLYNLAAMFLVDRAPYTRGLERELDQLRQVDAEKLKKTALWKWIVGQQPMVIAEPVLLAEPFPLNLEQYQAVQQALSAPLSVVTGPPGTGKSQVVASIMINALLRGQRVLFSSKNNKAVDVVVERLNNLTATPLVLRLGDRSRMEALAIFLQKILHAAPIQDASTRFEEAKKLQSHLFSELTVIQLLADEVIKARNKVDEIERSLDQLRIILGEKAFAALAHFSETERVTNPSRLAKAAKAVARCDRTRQGLLGKLFWKNLIPRRLKAANVAINAIRELVSKYGLSFPEGDVNETNVGLLLSVLRHAAERHAKSDSIAAYIGKLRSLQLQPSIFNLAQQQYETEEKIAKNSMDFLRYWQQLIPTKINQTERISIGNFATLTKLIAASRGEVAPKEMTQYYQLLPSVSSIFTSWAVTSLSVRNRIPFLPGFFDLLVIDEASQCDIASALPLLYRSKKAVVIGDPNQLSHITKLTESQDLHLLSQFNLSENRPSWSYSSQSLFHLAQTLCEPSNTTFLRDHHRSHEKIISFSNNEFYGSYLRVATHYDKLKLLKGDPVVRWLDVQGSVIRPYDGSALNQREVDAVLKELKRIVEAGYDGTIGVVSPFRAQTNRILDQIRSDHALDEALKIRDILVDTVHRFQGDERDLMVFSPVVSENIQDSAIHFLARTGNLFNVAITRARSALVVVGDRKACSRVPISYLNHFVEYISSIEQEKTYDTAQRQYSASTPTVSEWEDVLHKAFADAGIETKTQHPVEQYRLDFAIFANKRKLDVEVDGERYHRDWDGELLRKDLLRNRRLIELGWDVIRFWVYEVRDDLEGCVKRVRDWIELQADA